jgi:FkbM family methyltransferase
VIYLVNGYEFDLEVPAFIPQESKDQLSKNNYEVFETKLILEAIKPNHRVLEGGTGLGITALLIGKLANFLITFEPLTELAEAAKNNLQKNGNQAQVVTAALSTKTGVSKFKRADDLWGSHLSNEGQFENIETVDAQEIIHKNNINALVLDVEGEEEKILAETDLTPIETIIAELHPHIDQQGVLAGLHRNGFMVKDKLELNDHMVLRAER